METAAKIAATLLLNLALFLACLPAAIPWHLSFRPPNPSMCSSNCKAGPPRSIPHVYSYTRFADVERRCQSVLSSAAELKASNAADRDGGVNNLMHQLSFMNGDWSQDAGEGPLFPFHGSYADDDPAAAAGADEVLEAVPVASFSLRHMDMAQQRPGPPRTAFNASGMLCLAIARNSSCSSYYDSPMQMEPPPPPPSPEFELRPGIARLQITFQGVYTETSGGERVLCMVGDALLPVRSTNSTDGPWDWAKKNRGGGGSSKLEPPAPAPDVSDGDILLVLRYPKTATLTSRAVRGVMTSTKLAKNSDNGAYFDTVRLVSQLPSGAGYQFRPQDTDDDLDAAAACDDDDDEHPAPFHEGDAIEMSHRHRHRGRLLNRGASPCDTVYQSIPNNQAMEVIPNWDCNGTYEFCSRLGPFALSGTRRPDTGTNATVDDDMAFTRSAIVVSGLQCKPMLCRSTDGDGSTAAARVAAVFRYVPPWEHKPMAARRTGLSGTTLSAEGVWIPSTGRTQHMVACLGGDKNACRYRVTLSVQTTVSMTRRGVVAGEITAMDGSSHPPLLFQQRLYGRFTDYWTEGRRMSYTYSKVDQARELLLRRRASQPARFRDGFVAKSLLRYPSVTAAAAIDDIGSLSNLAHELDLTHHRSMGKPPPPIVPEWIDGPFFELQMQSVGTLVGRSYSHSANQFQQQQQRRSMMQIAVELFERVVHVVVHGGEKRQQMILNVSAEFMAYGNGNCLGPCPVMSLEGVYNAEDGRMFLVGCRTVHSPRRRLLSMSRGLEDGMDCSIEVIVEYPPTTARWLIGWPAKVFIASTRDDDDPLHFNRTELHMVPILHQQRRLDELAVPVMKGFLSAIALLATIWVATRTSQ